MVNAIVRVGIMDTHQLFDETAGSNRDVVLTQNVKDILQRHMIWHTMMMIYNHLAECFKAQGIVGSAQKIIIDPHAMANYPLVHNIIQYPLCYVSASS